MTGFFRRPAILSRVPRAGPAEWLQVLVLTAGALEAFFMEGYGFTSLLLQVADEGTDVYPAARLLGVRFKLVSSNC